MPSRLAVSISCCPRRRLQASSRVSAGGSAARSRASNQQRLARSTVAPTKTRCWLTSSRGFARRTAWTSPTTRERRSGAASSGECMLRRIESLDEYREALDRDPGELAALYQDFLIRVTEFFRDPTAFDALRQDVLPTLCEGRDRKSTRLNSSHSQISYAVFCLKKKKR